ncbi:TRAP transporter small permease [Futiania mangrovi]|uniref:TRAP transporter small permease protein n=1 Tax=Futiania mangrovi TaxID=2959716 RepID=A0A9J6PEP1_9PROT|nr:TRAP transporter small permease [Futiania mangrovii]MCP1337161.1 TRAP transporter small permease [Futiania mangrovii]
MQFVYLVSALLGGCSLIATAALVLAQISARWLGIFLPVASDLAGYCLAATIFLTMPYAFRENAHVRVSLLLGFLPPRKALLLNAGCLILGIILMVFLSYYAAGTVWDSYRFNDRAMGMMATPLWIPKLAMAIGFGLTSLAMLHRLAEIVTGSSHPAAPRQSNGG